MANTSSAKKKIRVIERKTISREMYRNKIKTFIKKVESLITEKDQKSAMELLKKVDPKLQASKNKKKELGAILNEFFYNEIKMKLYKFTKTSRVN